MQPVNIAQQLLNSSSKSLRDRALTHECWRDFNFERALVDPNYGFFHLEQGKAGAGNFTLTARTAGTGVWSASAEAGYGPELIIDSGSTTTAQGPSVQWTGLGVYPKDGMTVYGDFQFRVDGNGTAGSFFLGLGTVDTTPIAAGSPDTVSLSDWIGWRALESTTLAFGVEDGTQDVSTTAVHTLLNGTSVTDGTEYVHAAFRWEVGKGLEVYQQRARVDASDVSIANEPDGPMVVTADVVGSGTTQPRMKIARFAFGYKYNMS